MDVHSVLEELDNDAVSSKVDIVANLKRREEGRRDEKRR